MKDKLYELINLELNQISKQVVNMHYEQHPEFKAYGVEGYKNSIQDAQYNLQFLLTAYQYNSLELLMNYLEWTDQLFNNLKLPKNTLLHHMELTRAVLNSILDESEIDMAQRNQLMGLLSGALEGLKSKSTSSESPRSQATPSNPYYERYESAIFNGDRGALNHLFSEMREAQLSIEFIYGEVMAVFQRQLGLLWHERKISVAKEHYSTAMSQYAMTLLYDQIFTTKRTGRRMFAACVSGELHEFGIRLIADYFEYKGWDTLYYGANNTEASLSQAIVEQNPDVIFLSCTMTYHLDHLERLIGEIRKSDIKIPICVGGYPFDIAPMLSKQIGADYYTKNFIEAFLLAERIVSAKREEVMTDGCPLECDDLQLQV